MSFEDLQAEVSLLLTQMENQPKDLHEIQEVLREKINEMKAFGLPIPDNFLKFEKELQGDFATSAKDDQQGEG